MDLTYISKRYVCNARGLQKLLAMCSHLHIYKGDLMGCQLYVVLWPYIDAPGCQLCLTEWPSPVDYLPEDVVSKVVWLALGGSSVGVICEQTHVTSHEPGIDH